MIIIGVDFVPYDGIEKNIWLGVIRFYNCLILMIPSPPHDGNTSTNEQVLASSCH
jgi:hypothetical protein